MVAKVADPSLTEYLDLSEPRKEVTDAFLYTLSASPRGLILNTGMDLNVKYKFRKTVAEIAGRSITTVNSTIVDNPEAILQRAADLNISFEGSFDPTRILSAISIKATKIEECYTPHINYRFENEKYPYVDINLEEAENPYEKLRREVKQYMNEHKTQSETEGESEDNTKEKTNKPKENIANDQQPYPGIRDANRIRFENLTIQRQLAIDGIIAALHYLNRESLSKQVHMNFYTGRDKQRTKALPEKLIVEAKAVSCQPRGVIESVIFENTSIIEDRLEIDSLNQWFNERDKKQLDFPSNFKIPYEQLRKQAKYCDQASTVDVPMVAADQFDLSYMKTKHASIGNVTWDSSGSVIS